MHAPAAPGTRTAAAGDVGRARGCAAATAGRHGDDDGSDDEIVDEVEDVYNDFGDTFSEPRDVARAVTATLRRRRRSKARHHRGRIRRRAAAHRRGGRARRDRGRAAARGALSRARGAAEARVAVYDWDDLSASDFATCALTSPSSRTAAAGAAGSASSIITVGRAALARGRRRGARQKRQAGAGGRRQEEPRAATVASAPSRARRARRGRARDPLAVQPRARLLRRRGHTPGFEDEKPNELLVAVAQGRGLPALDRKLFGGAATSDPRCRLALGPQRRATSRAARDLAPEPLRCTAKTTATCPSSRSKSRTSTTSSNDFIGRLARPRAARRQAPPSRVVRAAAAPARPR